MENNTADVVWTTTEREHMRYPRNDGPFDGFNGHARITGPCGETMEFWLLVQDVRIERASFSSDGCGTSHACGSAAAFLAETEPIEEAARMQQEDVADVVGGLAGDAEHCALLAANALKAACEDYLCEKYETMEEALR